MHMGSSALYLAAQMLSSKARVIAAHLLQADSSEVSFSAGRFAVVGSERGIDLPALAEAARDPTNLPDGMTPDSMPTPTTTRMSSPFRRAVTRPKSRSTPKPER
jgi:CO/xanthine dehydrogenase Mo-binding subunit